MALAHLSNDTVQFTAFLFTMAITLCQWVSSTCLSVPISWIPLNYLETKRIIHLSLRLLCLQSAVKQKPLLPM